MAVRVQTLQNNIWQLWCTICRTSERLRGEEATVADVAAFHDAHTPCPVGAALPSQRTAT